jgi:hypothetical protein
MLRKSTQPLRDSLAFNCPSQYLPDYRRNTQINVSLIFFSFAEDTPLGETKLGDLPKWLSRRNYSPIAMGRCLSRSYWRWQHKYMQPKYAGLTP